MKNRYLLKAALLATVVGVAACDNDGLTGFNVNPNDPENAPSSSLFSSATRNGVARWQGNFNLRGFELLSQHLAEVQYPESDQYLRLRASSTSANFNNAYSNELQDFQIVLNRGRAADDPGLGGPAVTMKSWEMGIITDAWGDVPYFQAFRGDSGILNPVYTPQDSIYRDFFKVLDSVATRMIGAGVANRLGNADPIYGGSPAAWARFANSLRARYAMRLSYKDAALANTQLTQAFAHPAGLIDENSENAELHWPGGLYENPWAVNFQTRDDHRISTRLITYMAAYNDPRVDEYAQQPSSDTSTIPGKTLEYCNALGEPCYMGLENALTHDVSSPLLPFTSNVGARFFEGTHPSYLMTAAEVLFIRAEAAERSLGGLTPAQAAGFYNAAITASMEQWGIGATDIATYLAQPAVVYTPGAAGLRQIAIQKWIALYSDGMQAWAEFRRTCQPAVLEPGPAALVDTIPFRLYYSTNERAVNATNLEAAIARQGADNFLTRVWWNKYAWTTLPTYEAGCGVRE